MKSERKRVRVIFELDEAEWEECQGAMYLAGHTSRAYYAKMSLLRDARHLLSKGKGAS